MRNWPLESLLDPESREGRARGFRWIHHLALFIGLCAVVASTVPNARMAQSLLLGVALLVALFFLLEWLIRLVRAPLLAVPRGRPGARQRYLLSHLGVIDLLSGWGLPLALLLDVPPELAATAGVIWVLKLARYVAGFSLIGRVLRNERGPLLSVLAAFAIVLLLASTAVYLLEREGQPEAFGSLPSALWWCIVTLTTTGYGDVVPVTALGRVIAGLVMILGIAIFALCAGIVATGFAAEIRRRDFLGNWNLVAKVPLFQTLGVGVIAEVARLLRPRRLPAGVLLLRKGDPGDCMYFIVEGEVEVAVEPMPVRLGEGAFLGEMALVTGEPRSASVTTRRATQLLTLDIADFRALAGRHPELTRAIEAEAARRRAVTQ